MKIAQIERVKLVEGLDRDASRTYRLWESAGQVLKEFQLDQKQIDQLFAQVEKDATAAPGGNRTMLGKGIDTTTAAGKAVKTAYDDLVDKVQKSAPMQNADAEYDKLAAQLKTATGGDAGVMKYVQKYRDFATKHPIAQSAIYAALIAAVGISGAGLGGAAVLGLLKMTDQLLQGKKFSTALGKGAMTGATAYAASNLLGGGDLPSDPNAPGYQVDAGGPADIGSQSFAPPPETSQNFGLTPGGVDPNATQNAIDAAKNTAVDSAKAGAQSAASTAATTRASDAATLAADQAGGGVTDIDTLKQGIAANSDAAQAATNTDAASALSSQSDATVNTATDFASQSAPSGQAASSYAGGGSDAAAAAGDATQAAGEVTMKSAQEAAKAATSRLADAAPGSLTKSAAEQMLQQDLHRAVTDAVTSGKLGSPTDLNFTSRISDFVNNYVADKGHLVKDVSGKSIGGTMQQILRSTGELAGKAAASGTGSHEFVGGALVREYIDAQSTVRYWALKESLGRPRGGVQLTEAGVQRLFAIVAKQSLNEGIMDTLKGAAGKVTGAIKGAAGKAGTALKQTASNLTNKITADKLKKAWEFEGGNTDSEAIKIFLKQQGVDSSVIDSSMKAVGVPAAAGAAVSGGADAAKSVTGAPPAAGGSQFVQDLVAGYMALTPQERAEIMKELDIAIDVSGNSNLVKGMNEGKRRKKKAVR